MFFSFIKESIKANVSSFFTHLCQAINTYSITNSTTASEDFRSVLGFNRGGGIITQFCQNISCINQTHIYNPLRLAKYWLNSFDFRLKDCAFWGNDIGLNHTTPTTPTVKPCKNFSYIMFTIGMVIAFVACAYFYFLMLWIRKEFTHTPPLRESRRHLNNTYVWHRTEGISNRHITRIPEERVEIIYENAEEEDQEEHIYDYIYENAEEEDQEEHTYDYIDPSTLVNVENCQSIAPLSQHETTRL